MYNVMLASPVPRHHTGINVSIMKLDLHEFVIGWPICSKLTVGV